MSESRALKPIDEVRHTLDRMAPQFKMALPKNVPVEKFVRVIATAVQTNPDLADPSKCERTSLYAAAMRLAQDGLLPDGREAAIVPFKGKAQAMPMVAGIVKKIHQSGEVKVIEAHVVYSADEYDAWVDETGSHFKHRKARGERGKPVYTYAYAITKDGGFYFEELDERQIDAIRQVSRGGNSGPWGGAFIDEMRRKSAIRRLSKRLPMSTEDDEIIHRDDELFHPPADTPAEPPPEPAAERKRPGALDRVVRQGQQRRDTSAAQDAEARAPKQQPQDEDVTDGPPAGHPAADAPPADVI